MAKKLQVHSKDKIVHDVIKKFDERSAVGYEKYGSTLEADSDSLYRWVNDVQEELMDCILYMQKVKSKLTELAEESFIQDYKNNMLEDNTTSTTGNLYPGDITYDIVKP